MHVGTRESAYNNMYGVPVNRTDFYDVSILDSNLGYRLLQYAWFLYSILYVCFFDVRIVYLIRRHKRLTTPANIIIGCVLICDIAIVVPYSVTGILLTLGDKVWLSQGLCRMMTFLSSFPMGLQRCFLAIGTIEKVIYFIFVFQHPNIFSIERTMKYIVAAVTFAFVSSLFGSLGSVIYNHDFLLCSFTGVEFTTASVVEKFAIIFRVSSELGIFVGTFILQTTTFFWCWKVAKTDKTLNKDGQIWRRMMRNFLSLFSVTLVIATGAVLMQVSHSLEVPLLKRIGVFLFVYGSSFLNPIIVLNGNLPLRHVFIKRRKTFITNFKLYVSTITTLRNDANFEERCSGTRT